MRHDHHRLLRPALLAGLALLTAAAIAQPAKAQTADNLSPDPWPVRLVVPGQQLTLPYVFNSWYGELPTGAVYLRNDLQRTFTRLPMVAVSESAGYGARALVAHVPASLVRGHQLFYYAVLRDAASGRTATIPAGGASHPELAWVLNRPAAVSLGVHSFGRLRAPDAIVATAGPRQVGFYQPPEGAQGGPWSFDLPRDGSIWLSDQENSQLLVWQPRRSIRPVRSVKLSDPAHIFDFAVAPDGTIYVTYRDLNRRVPGMDYNLSLAALSPTGQVRWKGPTIISIANGRLRFGPDGALYWANGPFDAWTQLTTRAGRLLTIAEQRQRTSPGQPLSGGLQLVTTGIADHELRVALINQADRVVRAWRITSQNDLGGMVATPALVGGDPVLVTEIAQQTKAKFLYEFQVLRLAPNGGTRVRFALDPHAAWGDPPITGLRVGPDGQLYQLRTNPAWGVRIARYSLQPPKPTPPPTTITPTPGGGAVSPSTAPTTPPVRPQPQPAVPARSVWRALLPWLAAVVAVALAAAGEVWWWRRRQHRHHPAGPGRPHPVH